MLLYAWIAWNFLGGIVSARVIKNQVKKNERETRRFYENCNEILELLEINSRDYFDIYHYVCYNGQLDECLRFLISNNLVEYIPESRRYSLVK